MRHDLAAILAVVVVARLSGADSVYAAAQFAATMPQEALRRCGIRSNRRLGRYMSPSHKTIKRAVRKVDAQAADEQMCAWLRAEAAAGRLAWRHIAIDGKTLRGARDGDGKAPHLLAAYDVGTGTVLGQDDVGVKTNEITCFAPLLQAILDGRARRGHGHGDSDDTGSDGTSPGGTSQQGEGEGELVIVTADALHTQEAHVKAMNALGVAWMLILKDNQPGLLGDQVAGDEGAGGEVATESYAHPMQHDTVPTSERRRVETHPDSARYRPWPFRCGRSPEPQPPERDIIRLPTRSQCYWR